MIAEIAPVALGIAASPFPIIPAILLLFTQRPRATGGCFLAGWVVGILLACGVFAILATAIELSEETPAWASWARIALGIVLLVLALRQWRSRGEATDPVWMSALENASPASSLRLGLLLSAANPKILLLAAAGGLTIGSADLTTGQTILATVGFTMIASCTVALPWVLFLVRGERILTPLSHTRDWLKENNATIMSVVLTALGMLLITEGVSGL